MNPLVELKDRIYEILGQNGLLEQKTSSFKFREGQLQMAESWQKAISENSLLVCEAGTGTGKTFAYLIPVLLSGKCVVISTASKALQDQLVEKDLPALFDMLNLYPDFMSLKGFSNYLCLKKYHEVCADFLNKHALKFDESENAEEQKSDEDQLDELPSDPVVTEEILSKLELLIQKANDDIEKDLPNIDFVEVNSKFSRNLVSKITCASEWCNKKKCKYADECFPYHAREKAIRTRVVVINHSLFFSDMQIERAFDFNAPSILLPKFKCLIFDEAHELPAIGREHLSKAVGSSDIKKFTEDLRYIKKDLEIPYKPFEEQFYNIKEAYANVHEYFYKAEGNGSNKRNILYYKYKDFDEKIRDPFHKYTVRNEEFRKVMADLYLSLKNYRNFLKDHIDYDEDFFDRVINFLNFKMETITDLMIIDDDSPKNTSYGKYVGTAEVSKSFFNMCLTPLEISEPFGRYLSECELFGVSVLMTSATLAVNHKFSKFINDIGAPATTESLEVKSSFDYLKQAAFFFDEKFPLHDDPNRIESIINNLKTTIESIKGGIFFLTTSYDALYKARRFLYKHFYKKRRIYCQNDGFSNSEMLARFKKDGNAILIGTSSFWAGVDVPGNALSLVIIDKLPFENVSDPIFKARCDFFDAINKRAGASFIKISVPEAIIDLRQGVGRLIRHENDRGGLIICDPRLKSKGYGRIFIDSLPDMKQCSSLDELKMFICQDTGDCGTVKS